MCGWNGGTTLKDVFSVLSVTRAADLVPGTRRLERHENGRPQHHSDDAQRGRDRNVDELLEEHLGTDEDQHQREPELQVDELVNDVGEQEVERPQSEHRADVRRVYDEGIARHGKYRRYGIRGDDDVGGVDDHEDYEQ